MAPPTPPAAALMASPDEIEAQFYDALQAADLDRVMAVWSDDEDIVCVYPGGPRVVGQEAIRSTFARAFAAGPMRVRPENVRRIESPGVAVHSVLERVDLATAEGLQTSYVVATNVYLKTVHGWRLVAHHASSAGLESMPTVREMPSTLH